MKMKLKYWPSVVIQGITIGKEYDLNEHNWFIDDSGSKRHGVHGRWVEPNRPSKHATNGGYPHMPAQIVANENDENQPTVENSGGAVNYYTLNIPDFGNIKCEKIIDLLNMDFNEGTAFKAIWRKAAARQGKCKEHNTALRDAQKVRHSGRRMVLKELRK